MRLDVRSWFTAMVIPRGAAALLLGVLPFAFGCGAEPFACDSHEACTHGGMRGVCESTGYCSFADESCAGSGRRYGVSAPVDLASTCVAASKSCVKQLGLGGWHSCALVSGGSVRCWGSNARGQLGDTTTADAATPATIAGSPDAVKISAGENHTCALTEGGEVWCWGSNDAGQLGAATGPAPAKVEDLPPAEDVSAGGEHTCAVTRSGDVYCWGSNGHGQIGDGTKVAKERPVKLSGVGDVKAVAAGDKHSCAVQQDGVIFCWGSNEWGQCGIESPASESLIPAAATRMGDRGADRILAGHDHTCIVRGDKLWCWGSIGDGTFDAALAVVTGAASSHACALADRNGGELWCWGANDHGQLGVASTEDTVSEPARARLVMVTDVGSSGAEHTCAVTADGALWCWGDNEFGQLGAETGGKDSREPREVAICP